MKDKWIKWTDRAPEPADGMEVLVYWTPEDGEDALFSVAHCDGSSDGAFSWQARGGRAFHHDGRIEYPYEKLPTHWQPLEGPLDLAGDE